MNAFFVFTQILNLTLVIGMFALWFYSMWLINKQDLDNRSHILWMLVVIFVPLGMFLPLVVFRKEKRKNDDTHIAQPTKLKRDDTMLEDLLIEDAEEKRKFR